MTQRLYDATINYRLFMRRFPVFLLTFLLTLNGCTFIPTTPQPSDTPDQPNLSLADVPPQPQMVWPMDGFEARVTFKRFGQEVHDRFNGFHVGDDGEVSEEEIKTEVPVYAMADGTVLYRNHLSGYGGVLVLEHEIDGQRINSLYGHIDLGQTLVRLGDKVHAGTPIAYLGDDNSRETDGERKHLHFGIYSGAQLRLNGYAAKRSDIDPWINPIEYLRGHDAVEPIREIIMPTDWQTLDLKTINESFRLTLRAPSDWQAAYNEGSQAIVIYDPALPGEQPLQKAMLFLRYFDANDFQTLSTVTIHERFVRKLADHDAVDYLIEKKSWATNFPSQPDWRNLKHWVTDVREQEGTSRFYVIAQRPDVDPKLVYYLLESVTLP